MTPSSPAPDLQSRRGCYCAPRPRARSRGDRFASLVRDQERRAVAARRSVALTADGGAFIESLHTHVATADNADGVLREVDGAMELGETAERVLGGAVGAWALSAAPQRRALSGEEWPQQQ